VYSCLGREIAGGSNEVIDGRLLPAHQKKQPMHLIWKELQCRVCGRGRGQKAASVRSAQMDQERVLEPGVLVDHQDFAECKSHFAPIVIVV
jgi:hypothetical protein